MSGLGFVKREPKKRQCWPIQRKYLPLLHPHTHQLGLFCLDWKLSVNRIDMAIRRLLQRSVVEDVEEERGERRWAGGGIEYLFRHRGKLETWGKENWDWDKGRKSASDMVTAMPLTKHRAPNTSSIYYQLIWLSINLMKCKIIATKKKPITWRPGCLVVRALTTELQCVLWSLSYSFLSHCPLSLSKLTVKYNLLFLRWCLKMSVFVQQTLKDINIYNHAKQRRADVNESPNCFSPMK